MVADEAPDVRPADQVPEISDDDNADEEGATLLKRGVELYFEGRYDEARDRLKASCEADSSEDYHEEAEFFLGLIEAHEGHTDKAWQILSDLMECDGFGDLATEVAVFLELGWPVIPISPEDLEPPGDVADLALTAPASPPVPAHAYVIGTDPWSDRLVLVPEAVARHDVMFNHAVYEPTTMGKVRAAPGALEVLEEALATQMESRVQRWITPRLGRLPNDYPVHISRLLSESIFDYTLILPRLRTAELAPDEILDEFGHDDHEFGMDYKRATWLDPVDRGAITARMVELGFEVREDQGLIDSYLNV